MCQFGTIVLEISPIVTQMGSPSNTSFFFSIFELILHFPVNIFSVMSGHFLDSIFTKSRTKCLAPRHNAAPPVGLMTSKECKVRKRMVVAMACTVIVQKIMRLR